MQYLFWFSFKGIRTASFISNGVQYPEVLTVHFFISSSIWNDNVFPFLANSVDFCFSIVNIGCFWSCVMIKDSDHFLSNEIMWEVPPLQRHWILNQGPMSNTNPNWQAQRKTMHHPLASVDKMISNINAKTPQMFRNMLSHKFNFWHIENQFVGSVLHPLHPGHMGGWWAEALEAALSPCICKG